MKGFAKDSIVWKGDNKSSLLLVGVIFLLWGFITVLNNSLEKELLTAFELDYDHSRIVTLIFFAAYLFVGYPAALIISKIGFKKGITIGLVVAGIGALGLSIAAIELKYWLLVFSFFLLGSGFTFLQVGANTYVVLAGPAENAATRLNFNQALNSVGTWVAPLFAILIVASFGVSDTTNFDSFETMRQAQAETVTYPYIIIGSLCFLIAIMFFNSKLPEVKNQQKKELKPKKYILQYPHVVFAGIAIFSYVGAEVAIGGSLVNYILSKNVDMGLSDVMNYVAYYWGGAMVGRFIGAYALRYVRANTAVAFCALVAALLLGLSMTSEGKWALVTIVAIGLFNSILFPTIFTLGIANLGQVAVKAAAFLIMMIVGGAMVPMLMWKMIDWSIFSDINGALVIPIICYAYIVYYGLFAYKSKWTGNQEF